MNTRRLTLEQDPTRSFVKPYKVKAMENTREWDIGERLSADEVDKIIGRITRPIKVKIVGK